MTANTYKPGQITALYARLSQEDTLEGDSNSIVNQENICQGGFHLKDEIPPIKRGLVSIDSPLLNHWLLFNRK